MCSSLQMNCETDSSVWVWVCVWGREQKALQEETWKRGETEVAQVLADSLKVRDCGDSTIDNGMLRSSASGYQCSLPLKRHSTDNSRGDGVTSDRSCRPSERDKLTG